MTSASELLSVSLLPHGGGHTTCPQGACTHASFTRHQPLRSGRSSGGLSSDIGTRSLGRGVYRVVDQKVIDGAINGAGTGANWTGGLIKFAQSGNVQFYAGAMFIGVFVFAVLFAAAA